MYTVNEKLLRKQCIEAHGEIIGEVAFGLERSKAQAKIDRLNELQAQRKEYSRQLTALDPKHAAALAPLIAARDEIRTALRKAEQAIIDQVGANDRERNVILQQDTEAQIAMRAVIENHKPAEWKIPEDFKPTRIEYTLEEIQMAAQYQKDVGRGYRF